MTLAQSVRCLMMMMNVSLLSYVHITGSSSRNDASYLRLASCFCASSWLRLCRLDHCSIVRLLSRVRAQTLKFPKRVKAKASRGTSPSDTQAEFTEQALSRHAICQRYLMYMLSDYAPKADVVESAASASQLPLPLPTIYSLSLRCMYSLLGPPSLSQGHLFTFRSSRAVHFCFPRPVLAETNLSVGSVVEIDVGDGRLNH
jgi:hypothetical protein